MSDFKMDFRESLSILIKCDAIVRWINFRRNIKKEQKMPSEELKAGLSSVTHSCHQFSVSVWLLARERITTTRIRCRKRIAYTEFFIFRTLYDGHVPHTGDRQQMLRFNSALRDDIEVIKTTLYSDVKKSKQTKNLRGLPCENYKGWLRASFSQGLFCGFTTGVYRNRNKCVQFSSVIWHIVNMKSDLEMHFISLKSDEG